MQNRMMDVIVRILFATMIIDGLAGEFSSPTIFDFIKWGCGIVCAIAYIFYLKSKTSPTS